MQHTFYNNNTKKKIGGHTYTDGRATRTHARTGATDAACRPPASLGFRPAGRTHSNSSYQVIRLGGYRSNLGTQVQKSAEKFGSFGKNAYLCREDLTKRIEV